MLQEVEKLLKTFRKGKHKKKKKKHTNSPPPGILKVSPSHIQLS